MSNAVVWPDEVPNTAPGIEAISQRFLTLSNWPIHEDRVRQANLEGERLGLAFAIGALGGKIVYAREQ